MINDARAGIISCATLDNTPTQTGFFLKVFYCISASLSYSTMYCTFANSSNREDTPGELLPGGPVGPIGLYCTPRSTVASTSLAHYPGKVLLASSAAPRAWLRDSSTSTDFDLPQTLIYRQTNTKWLFRA